MRSVQSDVSSVSTGISGISIADFNSLLERESARTQSECMSKASTMLQEEMSKEKDMNLKRTQEALEETKRKLDEAITQLLDKTSEAARYKALSEAQQAQIDEIKLTSKSWYDLADTLRKDQKEMQKEMFNAWRS